VGGGELLSELISVEVGDEEQAEELIDGREMQDWFSLLMYNSSAWDNNTGNEQSEIGVKAEG
jgi:hypothetical protein